MIERVMDIWTVSADALCVTTNGGIRKDGSAVMGRGVAAQAKRLFQGTGCGNGQRTWKEVRPAIAPALDDRLLVVMR